MNLMLIKNNKTLQILLLLLFVTIPAFLFAAKQLPVETKLLWERDFIYVSPGDFNKDSIDELLVIKSDDYIEPLLQNLYNFIASRSLTEGTFDKKTSICGGLDNENMWATYVRHDSLFIYDIWPRRELFVVHGNDFYKLTKGWDGGAAQIDLIDINCDGRLEAIVLVGSAYDLKPRGIFVLDWQSGKLLWKFLCGPMVLQYIIRDVNMDGKLEILFGSFAAGNGNIEGNTDDLHTYIFLVDTNGKLLWKKEIGIYSSYAQILLLDDVRNTCPRIAVIETGNPAGGRECDSIFILDAITGDVICRAQYGIFNQGYSLMHDNKDNHVIAVGGSDDTLRLIDENLNLISKKALNCGGCRAIITGDFTGNSKNEIAVSATNGQLLLFDNELKLLAQFPTGIVHKLYTVRAENKVNLLVNLDRNYRTIWQFLEFNKVPLLNRGVSVVLILVVTIVLFLLFGIVMIYVRYQKTRDIRMVIRGLIGKSGVIEINHKGNIVNISQRAREILKIDEKDTKVILKRLTKIKQVNPILELAKSMLIDSALSSPQEIVISMSQEQPYLVRCIRVKKGVLITFEDISAVEYMKRVTSWTPVAQKLAHGIKNPLSTILGAVEQMEIKCQENGVKKYIGYVKDEVTKLKKMADAFMRFTKSAPAILEPKNINEIIKKIMAKYEPLWERGERSEKRGDIKVEYEMGEKLPLLNLDEEGISNALNIIIENAIEAMKPSPSPLSSPIEGEERSRGSLVKGEEKKRGGILRIRTIPEERLENEALKQYIKIEISDTGAGIPEKYLEKVFDPYFTYNKPLGTGLGLTLAKKIIEDHKGYIEINGKEGVGTQVNIYLPLK